MTTETAAPIVEQSTAASENTEQQVANPVVEGPEGEAEKPPEKTAHELRIEQLERDNKRMQRGIDRRTRQLAEERAQRPLTREPIAVNNQAGSNDSDTVSLTKGELQRQIQEEAQRLAPSLREQTAEVERRQGVVQSLEKQWGSDKFAEYSSDLEEAFGGLQDRSGRPKPALEAVFEADSPAQVIEYLADPENADEAERISRLSAVQAGKAIARLEDGIKAKAAEAKPKPSSAAAPLEALRSTARTVNGAPDPANTKAWIKWANEQERKGA